MSRSATSRLQAPWLLIAPSLVLALFIISYPIFNIVWQSLHEVSRFGAIRDFTGLQNFYNVFSDPVFLASTRRTLIWTVFVVGGTVLISVPVALVIACRSSTETGAPRLIHCSAEAATSFAPRGVIAERNVPDCKAPQAI